MKKIYLFGGLLLIVALTCSGVFFYTKQQKAKNLENFYSITSNDPLFYSPFFDQKNFEEAVNGLIETEYQTKKTIIANLEIKPVAENDWYIGLLKETDLYPYEFLKKLALVSLKTEEFLKQPPSLENSENLLNLYDQTADLYIKSASTMIKAFDEIEERKTKNVYFFMVDSVSSATIIKNDFKTIIANGQILKTEIKNRRSCLRGAGSCEKLTKSYDNSAFLNSLNTAFNLTGDKIDFIRNNLPLNAQDDKISGPYKIKSSCWSNANSEQWLYLIYGKYNDKTIATPKLANQNYYRKIQNPAKTKTDQILLEAKLEYLQQIETTAYECTDITFYPELLTIDFLKNKINDKQITADDINNDKEYKLLVENQFGLMAPAINKISNFLNVLGLYHLINNTTDNPYGLYASRSVYSIFYFPFAKSIWRTDKNLQYFASEKDMPAGVSGKEFYTIDYFKKLGYKDEDIKKFNYPIIKTIKAMVENQ